jgi:hypothetical protein
LQALDELTRTRSELTALRAKHTTDLLERASWLTTLESALSTQRDAMASQQSEIKIERYQYAAARKQLETEVKSLKERVRVQTEMIAGLFERVKEARSKVTSSDSEWKKEAGRLAQKSANMEKALIEAKGDADKARMEKVVVERCAGRWIDEWSRLRGTLERELEKEIAVS